MLLKFPMNEDRPACPMCHKIPKWFYGFDVMDEGESLFELSIKCDCANASYTFSSSEIDSLDGKYDNLSSDLEEKVYSEYRRVRDKIEDEKKKLLNKSIDELMQDNTNSITIPTNTGSIKTFMISPTSLTVHDPWSINTTYPVPYILNAEDSIDVAPYLINTGVASEVMDKIKDAINDYKPDKVVEEYNDIGDLPKIVGPDVRNKVYYLDSDKSINLVDNPDKEGEPAMYRIINDPASISKEFNVVDLSVDSCAILSEGDIVLSNNVLDPVEIVSGTGELLPINTVSARDIRILSPVVNKDPIELSYSDFQRIKDKVIKACNTKIFKSKYEFDPYDTSRDTPNTIYIIERSKSFVNMNGESVLTSEFLIDIDEINKIFDKYRHYSDRRIRHYNTASSFPSDTTRLYDENDVYYDRQFQEFYRREGNTYRKINLY